MTRSWMVGDCRSGRNGGERVGGVAANSGARREKGRKRENGERGGRVIGPGHQGVSGASAEEQTRAPCAGSAKRRRGVRGKLGSWREEEGSGRGGHRSERERGQVGFPVFAKRTEIIW